MQEPSGGVRIGAGAQELSVFRRKWQCKEERYPCLVFVRRLIDIFAFSQPKCSWVYLPLDV